MKKFLFLLVLSVIALGIFVSCENNSVISSEDGPTSVLNGNDTSLSLEDYFKFSVVYNAKSMAEVSDAAKKLSDALETSSGKPVRLITDDTSTDAESEYEIIVGYSKRDAYKPYSKIPAKSYIIEYSGTKIIINGGTYLDTVDAVDYFIENYITEGEDAVSLKSGEKYEYAFAYPELVINGLNMRDYALVNTDKLPAEWLTSLREKIENAFGFEMTLADTPQSKNVLFSVDEPLGKGKYISYSEGDTLHVLGGDFASLCVAFEKFASLIPETASEGEIVTIDADISGEILPSALDSDGMKHFKVETDLDALDYRVGDSIEFEAVLLSGDEISSVPLFQWTVSPEGGEAVSGYSAGGNGKVKISSEMKQPGFVLLTVKACDENGNEIESIEKLSAGAGVSVNDIRVAAEEPLDWEAFWEKQLARLDKTKPNALEMNEDGSNNDYYIYDIKVDCPGDERWTGETYSAIYVSVPKNVASESLGIYVKFMGAGVRSTETHLSRKPDYICVSVNGHSIPSRMDGSYYNNLAQTTLKGYATPKDENEAPEDVFYSYMVMRDLQALRFVKSYFGSEGENLWDGERLEVAGMSEGGYQALFTAALDKDVSFCTADVPAMCDKQGKTIGRKGGYGSSVSAMLYYDTCYFARRIECPVKIMVGLGDVTCVPSSIAAMYNELKCEKEIVYVQNMGHTYPNSSKIQQKYTFTG